MMRRLALHALGFLGLVLLLAGVGSALLEHFDPAPLPLAIDNPKAADVVLWPGSAEEPPASPQLLLVPCPLGPANLPIVDPEETV